MFLFKNFWTGLESESFLKTYSLSVLTILLLIFACFDISWISHVNRARAETCCVKTEIYYSKMVANSFEKVWGNTNTNIVSEFSKLPTPSSLRDKNVVCLNKKKYICVNSPTLFSQVGFFVPEWSTLLLCRKYHGNWKKNTLWQVELTEISTIEMKY